MRPHQTFRLGFDSLAADPVLSKNFCDEVFSTIHHKDEELLRAAQSALEGVGVGMVQPELSGSAAGAFSAMRVLRDGADTTRSPYAMTIQKPLPHSPWYLGTAGMHIGPGPSLPDFHGAESEVVRRAVRAGVSAPTIVATHQDAAYKPPFTFSIQDYVAGLGAEAHIAKYPEEAARVMKDAARELVTLHSLAPDDKRYGYFHPLAAEEGELTGAQIDARSHYLSALGTTLTQIGIAGIMGFYDSGAISDFFRKSPVIDLLDGRPKLLHGDFGPPNIIVRDVDGKPSLIDFASTLAGPIEYDLATMQEALAVFGQQQYWDGFLQEYERAGGELIDEFAQTYSATRLRMTLSRLGCLAAMLLDTADTDTRRPRIGELVQANLEVVKQEADKLAIPLRTDAVPV